MYVQVLASDLESQAVLTFWFCLVALPSWSQLVFVTGKGSEREQYLDMSSLTDTAPCSGLLMPSS